MDRVRRTGSLALFLLITVMAVEITSMPPPFAAKRPLAGVLAAAVSWPMSTLLVSEVVTGGASASDEFVELTNAGPAAVDLAGLEVVYATSTGGTVTRKASWSASTILESGRHLLIANTTGTYAVTADATYSGGFAATGGALVIRPVGGTPVDAVGWGDATNAFVEGTAAGAPPAGSSIERLPGGSAGNGTDTNDNAADLVGRSSPTPQNLAAPATPGASASPSSVPTATPTPAPTATIAPSASASESPSPSPNATAVPGPTPTPTTTPIPAPTPTPTPLPTPAPTPVPMPTPTPTPVPTVTPTPTPAPIIRSIAEARGLPDGSVITIQGTLTTALGAIDSDRNGFVQDLTGGIAIRLDAALAVPYRPGTTLTATGTLGRYFSLRTLAVQAADIGTAGTALLPDPLAVATGAADEQLEGLRLTVIGVVAESPSALADGLGVTVDDGTGPIRTVISSAALGGAAISTGDTISVTGPLGQRDSSGTGLAGYRLHATQDGEVVVTPPTPSPSATPDPTPSQDPAASPTASPNPTASATATPAPTPSPAPIPTVAPMPSATPTATPAPSASPSPTATGAHLPIAIARALPIGTVVDISGVVTAEDGRLGTASLIPIQDSTAGIVVRLPAGVARPARGTTVAVRGTLAEPYGQREVRPSAGGVQVIDIAALPAPVVVGPAGLGEANESRIVTISGVVQARPTRSTSGDISLDLRSSAGTIRVVADSSSGLTRDSFVAGATYDVVGIVGQHATRVGARDGYRIWLRDAGDVARRNAPGTTPTPTPSRTPGPSAPPTPKPSGTPGSSAPPSATISIADTIRAGSGTRTVEGVVTTAPDLLDTSGRRIVIEDRTAGIEVLVPADARVPAIGSRIRVVGAIGRAWDAPRLKATRIEVLGTGQRPLPITIARPPTAALEWRLVQVAGTVADLHKLGDRWRAELAVGTQRIVITGLAGARIPVTTLAVGRRATVVGLVRRPYPGATDRRWSVVPRGPADVVVAAASAAAPAGSSGVGTGASSGRRPSSSRPVGSHAPGEAVVVSDVDLVSLAEHVGQTVRVGGLVADLAGDGFLLDDGSAVGKIRLTGSAGDYLTLLQVGDALNATGRIERNGAGYVITVDDAAGLVRAGDTEGESAATGSGPTDVGRAVGAVGPSDATASEAPAPASRLAGGLLDAALPGAAGLFGLVVATGVSVGVTLLRRARARRRLARRVVARVAGFGAAGGHQA